MNVIFFFKSKLIYTFSDLQNQKTVIVLFYILNKKNVLNASDLIFTSNKCYLFLEQGILSEMFPFKVLTKSNTWPFAASKY